MVLLLLLEHYWPQGSWLMSFGPTALEVVDPCHWRVLVVRVLPIVLPVFILLPRQKEPLVAMLMAMMVLLEHCCPQG